MQSKLKTTAIAHQQIVYQASSSILQRHILLVKRRQSIPHESKIYISTNTSNEQDTRMMRKERTSIYIYIYSLNTYKLIND